MSSFTCVACEVTFHDSLSHGMHLLTRRHRERVGQQGGDSTSSGGGASRQPTLNDLRMLIERMRAEKETALFGKRRGVAAGATAQTITNISNDDGDGVAAERAGQRRGRDDGGVVDQRKSYYGQLSRDPAPHEEVLREYRRLHPS